MLRAFAFLILTSLSLQAFAGNFDFLPNSGGPQKEFQTLMERGNYRQALLTWQSSQGQSTFAQSTNGMATWSYLLYQNGMPFTALQTLMQTTQPAKLDARLLKLWTTEIKTSKFIQKGWVQTLGGWKAIVNNEPVLLKISKKSEAAFAFVRADKIPADNVNGKARLWWQVATRAPLIGDTDSALRALKLLRESSQTIIGTDLLAMTQGRVLYQRGELDAAMSFYQQIPKNSSLWVEGVEERAWTHLRQDDYDKAMGDITTAISPVLQALAGPETYFLSDLIAYKACDYTRVFNTSETFKARHRNRLTDIQELATKGSNKFIAQAFEIFDTKGVSQETAGTLVNSLPRGIFRDEQFVRTMESRRELLTESKVAAELFEDSQTLGGNANLQNSLSEEKAQAERLRQVAFQRARTLAQVDIKEYRMVLNKMHIIEGEVIERLHMDDNLKGQRSKLSKTDDSGDVLVFPYTKEVWMDELDNYKARVKDCPTLKGASL